MKLALSITLAATFAATIAFGQETTTSATPVTIDSMTQMLIESWKPDPMQTLRLTANTDMTKINTILDEEGLTAGSTTVADYMDGCLAMIRQTGLDYKSELCSFDSQQMTMLQGVKDYVLNGSFILNVDPDLLAQVIVTQMGDGRVKTQLNPLKNIIVKPFSMEMFPDYIRWRENLCPFTFIEGDFYGNPENRVGKPTKEQCGQDRFAQYLMDTYCAGDIPCDFGRLSWAYGFLGRRELRASSKDVKDGEAFVQAWQKAMYAIAMEAGITMPQPYWQN